VGCALQKIFQGRRSKARQISFIEDFFPILLILILYIGIIFSISSLSIIWFALSLLIILINILLYFNKKRGRDSLYLLLSIMLFFQVITQFYSLEFIKYFYFPYFVLISYFFNKAIVNILLFIFPFICIRNLFINDKITQESFFIISILLTGLTSSYLIDRLKIIKFSKTKNIFTYPNHIIENDLLNTISSEKRTTFDDEIFTYYFKNIFKPNEEIKDLLLLAKNSIFADSVHLFINYEGKLQLRCTTDETEKIIISDKGFIHKSMEENKSYILSDIKEKNINIGFYKKTDFQSVIIIPICFTNFPFGIIVAESARYHAFSGADRDILLKHANQIFKILQRERIYQLMYRSFAQLKILHDESSNLTSTLDTNNIIKNLISGLEKIIQSKVIFLKNIGTEFILFDNNNNTENHADSKTINIKNTIIDMIIKEKKPYYISDIKNLRTPILPIKINNIKSAYIIPMFYERYLLGLLIALSENINAFDIQQRSFLELFANQATTSLINSKFYSEIQQLAITDGLTGLYNHRHFQEQLSHEFKRYERFKEPFSILLIDIDYFKKINDKYGHQAGDMILKDIAKIIKKTVRNIDISARYGGEEFVVILTSTSQKEACRIAERIRKNIQKYSFTFNNESIKVTVSIGVSTYPEIAKTKDELFTTADKALYKAKENGRNLVILWKNE